MQIYILLDTSNLIDISELEVDLEKLLDDLKSWLKESDFAAEIVEENLPSDELSDPSEISAGIKFNISKRQRLKDPLNFIYSLAKSNKCEFSIAYYDKKSQAIEEVCYFGFEEGKPDLYEVATYLGL